MKNFTKPLGIFIVLVLVFSLAISDWGGVVKADNAGDRVANKADNNANLADRLSIAIALYTGSPTALVNNHEKQVDSGNGEVVPLVITGRVLVPIRFIAENLGAQVDWEQQTDTAVIALQDKVIRITLGKSAMYLNASSRSLDVPAFSLNGRTFVPLRAVSEAFGKKVFYDRGLILISDQENLFNPETEIALLDEIITRVNTLPSVNTQDNFLSLLEKYQGSNYMLEKRMANTTADVAQQAEAPAAAGYAGGSNEAAQDFSSTNVQVRGVDEADLVKTDGEYIYQVTASGVMVCKAYPAGEMSLAARLVFEDPTFSAAELYLDRDYLVVIGHTSDRVIRPSFYSNRVKTYIYDISDKAKISKVREVEVEGQYVSSRKIGSSLYLVALHYLNTLDIREKPGTLTPTYRDTAVQNGYIAVPYQEIRYIPPIVHPNYLVVAGLDLARPAEPAQISTYLGAGENIYVSEKNLYIALTGNTAYRPVSQLTPEIGPANRRSTTLYKFSLNQGKITYLLQGQAPGTILNQFSMDEYDKHFRIATTSRKTLSNGRSTTSNNVYILDESMSLVGSLEDIAPGEQIFSTRFLGERAYMVTFKNIDPLFVLDLKNPANPSILGALKIPGYSDYLHPYDENHLLGFGKDTVEVPQKDRTGRIIGTQAYYLGMKMALFDVSDVSNPKEIFSEKIGDRGTDSELLHNHKALLFNKETGLLAFPVTLLELQGKPVLNPGGYPEHGTFSFQGAYVYHLDAATGFTLKGRITHQRAQDLQKAGLYSVNSQREIKRALYIGDVIYTVSEEMLKANRLEDLRELNTLSYGD